MPRCGSEKNFARYFQSYLPSGHKSEILTSVIQELITQALKTNIIGMFVFLNLYALIINHKLTLLPVVLYKISLYMRIVPKFVNRKSSSTYDKLNHQSNIV